MIITETIKRYLKGVYEDPYHRYRSRDYCNQAFAVSEKNDRHALELAFYLASWGMYRGSSGLMKKIIMFTKVPSILCFLKKRKNSNAMPILKFQKTIFFGKLDLK